MTSVFGPKRLSLESRFLTQAGVVAPVTLFDEFTESITSTTLQRLKITAILGICINLLVFFALDLPGFHNGFAQSQPGFLYLVTWRIARRTARPAQSGSQAADATRLLYAFALRHDDREIASGRVAVVLGAVEAAAP